MDSNLYLKKFNNYLNQSVKEIASISQEHYKNISFDSGEIQELRKREYVNNLTLILKKLLNNTESIFSHSKFELINNCISDNKKMKNFNDGNILDLLGSVKSEYDLDEEEDDEFSDDKENLNSSKIISPQVNIESHNIFYCDEDEDEDNETGDEDEEDDNDTGDEEEADNDDELNNSDNKPDNADDSNDELDENNTNTVKSDSIDVSGIPYNLRSSKQQYDSCIARRKRRIKQLANNETPHYYFTDSDGYYYGHHCGKPIKQDDLCEKHYQKKMDNGLIELITDYPLKYESSNNDNEQSDTETVNSIKGQEKNNIFSNKNSLDLQDIRIRNKKYLVNTVTGDIYDYITKMIVGKRKESNRKNYNYEYEFFNT